MKADLSLAAALEQQVSETETEKRPSWERDTKIGGATRAGAGAGAAERGGVIEGEEHEDDSQGRKWFVGKAGPPNQPRMKGPDPSHPHGDGKRPSPKYARDIAPSNKAPQPQPPPSKPSGRGRMGMDSGVRKDSIASAVSGKMGVQKKVIPSYAPVLQDRKGSDKSEIRDVIPSPLSPEQYPFFENVALFGKSPRKDKVMHAVDAPARKMSVPMRPASPLDLDVGDLRGVRDVQDALLLQVSDQRGGGQGGGGRGFEEGEAVASSTMQSPYNLSKSSSGLKDPTHHASVSASPSIGGVKQPGLIVSEDARKTAEDAEDENYGYEDDKYEDDFIIAENENKLEHKDDISMLTDESKGKETSSSSTERYDARSRKRASSVPFAAVKEELEGERSADRIAGEENSQEQKYPAFNSFSTIGDTRDTPASQESARSPCNSDTHTLMEYSKSSLEEGSDESKKSAPTNLILSIAVPTYQPPTFVPPVQPLTAKYAVKGAGVMPTLAEMRRQKEEASKVKEESLQQVQVSTSVGPIQSMEGMAHLKIEKGELHSMSSLSPGYKGDARRSSADVSGAAEENESDDGYGDEEFHVSDDDEKREKHGRG